uniref:Uncharacterized protein n=1 Tax=Anopheles minimus TaxID=112268 RepID=A0A182WP44_9DIPT
RAALAPLQPLHFAPTDGGDGLYISIVTPHEPRPSTGSRAHADYFECCVISEGTHCAVTHLVCVRYGDITSQGDATLRAKQNSSRCKQELDVQNKLAKW